MILARFISGLYLKRLLLILVGLELFYVGIDLILNLKALPSSANLILLYALLTGVSALAYLLPLSLIFALISSFLTLARSGEFPALLSLGLGRGLLLLWPMIWAGLFAAGFIILQLSPLAYANDYKNNIKLRGVLARSGSGAFLMVGNKILFIEQLARNVAIGVKILNMDETGLRSILRAERAIFSQGSGQWILDEGEVSFFPAVLSIGQAGVVRESFKRLSSQKPPSVKVPLPKAAPAEQSSPGGLADNPGEATPQKSPAAPAGAAPPPPATPAKTFLKNEEDEGGKFVGGTASPHTPLSGEAVADPVANPAVKSEGSGQAGVSGEAPTPSPALAAAAGALASIDPKGLESISANNDYALGDLLSSLALFHAQGLATAPLRGELYRRVVSPFFAPFFMMLIFYSLPVLARFFNLALAGLIFFASTLVCFGGLLLLWRLAEGGVISPELGLLAPVLATAGLGLWRMRKELKNGL